ncbi:MAG: hypothetical protein R3D63_02150 [Paracoccaceae bacterium]
MVRGPVSLGVVGIITLLMFGLVVGGPGLYARFLPESAVAWLEDFSLEDMASLTGGGGSDSGEPIEHLRDSGDGWRPSDRIAAMTGNRAVFIKDVVSGRRKRGAAGQSPAAVEVVQPVTGCTVTPPAAGSLLGHVNGDSSSRARVELSTYGDAELAEAVAKFARTYRKSGAKIVSGIGEVRFDAFDVVVTEVAQPVYLVLQAGGQMRLWNLHLAPGARLERVVLLGGDQAGVANLPEGVPVEVMRNAEMAACGLPRPAYPLNPGHMLYQSLAAGHLTPEEAQETLDLMAAQMQAYEEWFRQSFGQGAAETMAGDWYEGGIAVVGPVPAEAAGRARWNKLDGATARITADTYVEYAGLAEQGTDFKARVMAVATAFAWGDLKNIRQGVEF